MLTFTLLELNQLNTLILFLYSIHMCVLFWDTKQSAIVLKTFKITVGTVIVNTKKKYFYDEVKQKWLMQK